MRRLMIVCLLCLMIAAPLAAQDDDPYAIALQRIEAVRESGATELDLSNLGLTQLPPEIGQLSNLQMLFLDGNELTSLPPEIGQLRNLRALSVTDNELTSLPSEIGQLSSLQWLSVDNNQLTTLPSTIGLLSNLCFLGLGRNNLRHLPASLSNLDLLTDDWMECVYTDSYAGLYLYDNPLISPPPEVIERGTADMLAYLRNPMWYHTQRLIIGASGGVGLFVLLLLGFHWKQRGGYKPKQKRG